MDKGGKEGKVSLGTEDLWKAALKKFQDENRITAKELEDLELAGDLGKATGELDKASGLFNAWRHPPDQNTELVKAVSGCLDWVDTAGSFIQGYVSGTVSALMPT
jgi:hypothetical protein